MVAVGEKVAEGRMDVASIVSKPVEGVNAGKIENIELVSRAIREAMSEAEEQLGIRILEAYAGISGAISCAVRAARMCSSSTILRTASTRRTSTRCSTACRTMQGARRRDHHGACAPELCGR